MLVAAALVLTACGSSRDADVADAATAFYAALADGDGAAACDLLAPETRSQLEQSAGQECAQAVLEEELPEPSGAPDVAAFDTNGQARFAGETAFLSRFSDGWKVVAAGCTPRDPRPYDCTLSGG